MPDVIDFQTDPSKYRRWRVEYDGPVASLFMDVDEEGGLIDGYLLKLNGYDLGVDIELADIAQRMRFERPDVKVIVLQSAKEKGFCAGGGYELALACNYLMLTDDSTSSVALPKVPLLAVLPGPGDLPITARPFYDMIATNKPDLSHVNVAVFVLGDMVFADTFAFGSKILMELLVERGARMVGERGIHAAAYADMPEDIAVPWAAAIFDTQRAAAA